MLPYRMRQIRRDIDLYINSKYAGFQTIETIEEYFEDYSKIAEKTADDTDWNSVVLFAVFEYDIPQQTFISANFMNLVLTYDEYTDFVKKLLNRTRFFFVRGRKDYYDY